LERFIPEDLNFDARVYHLLEVWRASILV